MAKVGETRDPEIEAIALVNAALKDLESHAQQRVLDYVARKLGLHVPAVGHRPSEVADADDDAQSEFSRSEDHTLAINAEDFDGINSVAKKWITRSGFTADQLSLLFSIGGDEIELIAKRVPGKTKRDRMRSVFLLKGVAAYLASGAARVTYEQVKEACLHYDAFDGGNFSKYLASMAAEISGTTKSGYTLTARGIVAATDIVRETLEHENSKK